MSGCERRTCGQRPNDWCTQSQVSGGGAGCSQSMDGNTSASGGGGSFGDSNYATGGGTGGVGGGKTFTSRGLTGNVGGKTRPSHPGALPEVLATMSTLPAS